ncbi:pyrroline-5-carboxylate reductase dimerization-domain-containing protein [Apiospora phragmitis]|uniref:Pyrroline-5-carboxylate reductase n=1 Tax=Apiospora phragmitis TaxID=2905665 RepID=A0ABR1UJE3_9PEZI
MAPVNLHFANLAFIGGGNMCAAIVGGLLAKGIMPKDRITVSEPWEVNRQKMADLGVQTTTSNTDAAGAADLLVLAVKPQVAKAVCQELAASWAARQELPLIVSIAAGITLDSLSAWFTGSDGRAPHVVRVMPNTPALLGEGASGLFAGAGVTAAEKDLVTAMLQSFSKATEWVAKEELIDVVTGLSGSGPAYFFAMVEHLVASAKAQGLSEEQAMRLAKQTCFGAGKMLVESSETPTQLRKNVTSPKGTTEAALKSFEASGFEGIVDKAVKAASSRGEELGKILGQS